MYLLFFTMSPIYSIVFLKFERFRNLLELCMQPKSVQKAINVDKCRETVALKLKIVFLCCFVN